MLDKNSMVKTLRSYTGKTELENKLTRGDEGTLRQRRSGNKRKDRGSINTHEGVETTRHRCDAQG